MDSSKSFDGHLSVDCRQRFIGQQGKQLYTTLVDTRNSTSFLCYLDSRG